MRWGTGAVAIACVTAIAGTTQAGDTNCIWKRLSQPTRDAMLGAYAAGSMASLPASAEGDITRATRGCGFDPATKKKPIGAALAGYALQEGSAHWLQVNAGLTAPMLDDGWDRLPPEVRAEFVRWTLAAFDNPQANTPPRMDMILGMIETLGLDDPMQLKHVTVYYTGRLMRAEAEPEF